MPLSSNARKFLLASFEAWKQKDRQRPEASAPITLELSELAPRLKLSPDELKDAARENVDLQYLEYPIQDKVSFVGVLPSGRNKAREIIEERRKLWRKVVSWAWHVAVTIGVVQPLFSMVQHRIEQLENRAATTQNTKP